MLRNVRKLTNIDEELSISIADHLPVGLGTIWKSDAQTIY